MWRYVVGAAITVLLFAALCDRGPVLIYSPKVIVRRTVEPDYDTIPVLRVDTVYAFLPGRPDSVPFQIPVWPYRFADSLPVLTNRGAFHLPFWLYIEGYVTEYGIEPRPYMFDLGPEGKTSFWWKAGAVGFGVIAAALAAKMIID